MTRDELVALVATLRGEPGASREAVEAVAGAVLAYVEGLPVIRDRETPAGAWPADVRLGAAMLATRLLRRRQSPDSLMTVTGDMVTTITRVDPDIARLLRLDAPAVG